MIDEKAHDTAVPDLGSACVVIVENGEVRAIETRQSVIGAQPQVTVGRLFNCGNGIMRQAVFRLPRAKKVTGEVVGIGATISDMHAGREEKQRQEDAMND